MNSDYRHSYLFVMIAIHSSLSGKDVGEGYVCSRASVSRRAPEKPGTQESTVSPSESLNGRESAARKHSSKVMPGRGRGKSMAHTS